MQKYAEQHDSEKVVIIGAGPAGLTAAYELSKAGVCSVVLEKDNIVGGIARTASYKGYRFDIGGHRFFTKVKPVEDMWFEVLGDDFLKRSRLSRIYYNKKFFYYPIRPLDALLGLGFWNSVLILLSYFRSQLFPKKPEETFEDWVSNRFGERLYETFFKTYTEKVWGIPCSEIRAEWAAQRIKGLSLLSALKNATLNQKDGSKEGTIKTLIGAFHYPKRGPGMMWERVVEIVQRGSSDVRLRQEVEKIFWSEGKVNSVQVKSEEGRNLVEGTHFISSMPVRELINRLEPAPPEKVINAAADLKYRDFLTVVIIVDKAELFPDNWIYIHDPEVKIGRIQNFKNWSPHMVPDQSKTCLGLEYFCFEGDGLWTSSDEELIKLGTKELDKLGLVNVADIEDGTVVRMKKAYPVYDSTYRNSLQIIRDFLDGIDNLQTVGRNGMHKYNNQDHSMLASMLAVKNILGANYDIWQVNAEQEYHEEINEVGKKGYANYELIESTQPRVPEQTDAQPQKHAADKALVHTFAKMDKFAFATALGSVCSLVVFIATLWLIFATNGAPGPSLSLLNEYFIGYTVSLEGAFIGMGYSFLWGFIFGWLFAYLRNLYIIFFIYRVKRKIESVSIREFFDLI